MFVLSELKDTVRVSPADLSKPVDLVVRDSLQAKYANRVVERLGLCIVVYDFEVLDNCLHPIDGGAHVHVKFRLVMFKPVAGQIMMGRIRQCDASGMLISVEFFDHICILGSKLQLGSHYDSKENLWVWTFEGHELYLDLQQNIRFRVEAVEFAERDKLTPNAKDLEKDGDNAIAAGTTIADFRPPMRVVASIQEDGLGLTSWWT
jgi:DNA-directed RNA polymerase III subunit RPC8